MATEIDPQAIDTGEVTQLPGVDSSGSAAAAAEDSSSDSVTATLRDSPVTVVGIGASAGGLEALSELFRHVPAITGLAYVVVQHMSATHGSILAELLSRQAVIPVHEATNGDRVEVDHVYVIAPDTKMTLTDGHLKLVPRDPGDRPPLPVDALFRSLAEVQESRTIGVILSGTGMDGALGVRAIRGAGGMTFVQEPASAGSEGMPLAAIATHCIDVVATPAEIAGHVARLGRHPYNTHPVHSQDPVTDSASDPVESRARAGAVSMIFSLLHRRFGVDFRLYKSGTVERRIGRRMALRKIDTITRYAEVLNDDTDELRTLYGDLLIGVTRFFRDPEVFNALSRKAIPKLLRLREAGRAIDRADGLAEDTPLRVWVAGCSTGEEAYSIAICLLEFLEKHAPGTSIQIFATDLSEAAVDTARVGLYPKGIEADVTPARLSRYFTNEKGGYRVTRAVRDCCTFAVQNLTTDPPFSRLDVVSCRNVLIYLQPSAHARLLTVFHYALKPNGVLILGTSESISTVASLFTSLDKKHRIYSRADVAALPLDMNTASVQPPRPPTLNYKDLVNASNPPLVTTDSLVTEPRATATSPDVQRAADQVVLGSYAPAGVVVDDELNILQFRGQTASYIEPRAGTASFQLLRMVRSELAGELRKAIATAREEARTVRVEHVPLHDAANHAHVTLDVTPFRVARSGAQFFVISFEDSAARASRPLHASSMSPDVMRAHTQPEGAKEIGELRQELDAGQRHLQTVKEEHESAVEEFQAASEEIQSSNEELQSTNEELETAKEELQSLNEELTTLNDELRVRNADADRINDDLTNLLSAMHVPVIMVGMDLRIRRFTAGAERMVNVIPTDIGRPIGDIKASIDVANLEELVARVIETLEVIEREVRDRHGRWFMMHIRPYRTSDHRIDGAVIVYQDIDERRRASGQLDDARQYAEAIVQTVREPLVVLDESFRGVSANRAFYDGFGTSPLDTINCVLFDLGNGQWNIPKLRELLERVRSSDESFDNVEVEHDFPSVGHRIMLLNARRVASGDAGQPLILLAMEDVTTRRMAETLLEHASAQLVLRADQLEVTTAELRGKTAEAQASNQAKTDFLTTMSHELRTPLNAIGGYAQLLDMGIRGPVTDAQHADLARITRSQEHLMGLINDILNFAKLAAGAVVIVATSVNVKELLASVEAMIASQMDLKDLRYTVRSPDGQLGPTLAVCGDPDKMRQILINLLTNALKFTASGGSVDITCDASSECVAIHVRDTGLGIPEAKLAAIFEPFIQINPSLTRPTEGIGLGLAISRELARAMGGDVTVESSQGVGSTFTLTLPRALEPGD